MFCNIRMELNCSSSRLALIDAPGVLSLLDLEARIPEDEEKYKMAFDIVLFYFILYYCVLFYFIYFIGLGVISIPYYVILYNSVLYYNILHYTVL